MIRGVAVALVRHGLHFSANDPYDSRAAWLIWPDLVKSLMTQKSPNVLRALWNAHRAGAVTLPPRRLGSATYMLPDLTVEVRIRY